MTRNQALALGAKYKIVYRTRYGKVRTAYYPTLESASRAAEDVFKATRIVIAIEHA